MDKPIGEACLARAEELYKIAPAMWQSDRICAYVIIDRETGKNHGSRYDGRDCLKGSVCHSSVPGRYDEVREDWVCFNTHKNIESEAQRAFAKWVAQDSPFAHGVINRNDLDTIYHGGMLIDPVLVGSGGVLWLCKAMRYIYESPDRVERFGKLVEQGVPPKAAFFVVSSYGAGAGAGPSMCYGNNEANSVMVETDHNSVQANMSPELFVKAYKAKPKKSLSHNTYGAILGTSLKGYEKDWLGFGGTKTVRIDDGWGGFTEQQVPVDNKESVDNLITFLKEKGCI